MMDIAEIKTDLTNFIRGFYRDSEVRHLDVPAGQVELRFSLDDEERKNVLTFFEDNIRIFNDYTEETRSDILEIEEIFIRFDEDGLYFGKSKYDFAASNAAAYYVLNRYLDDMVEELPLKLKIYQENYLYQ